MTAKTDDITLNELYSLIKARKTIVPFAKDRFSCASLSAHKNVVHVDLSKYKDIEEYCALDRTISVQCGIKVKQLQEFLASKKQWLPVAYADDETSLLDLILTGDAGPLEAVFGGLHRHILGLTFILANGDLAKSGGKVVKNVSGYDLTRFLIGSYGYFAIPIKACFRVYALPPESLSIMIKGDDFRQLLMVGNEILSCGISTAYIDLVDPKLLDEEFVEASGINGRFILALQIHGNKNSLEARATEVKNLLAQEKLAYVEIKEQEMFLQYLARISMQVGKDQLNKKKNRIIDLVLSVKEFLSFAQEKELLTFPFIYRSTSHRLRYCLSSEIEKDIVLDLLAKYSQKRLAPLTVAYNDDNYIRTVAQLAHDTNFGDKAISDIKQRLKNELDPDNLFNPFIKL